MSELINNREQRISTMRSIIEKLHDGAPADTVREDLRNIVRSADATEVAAMEQELIARGMPVENILHMCDLHHQVMEEVLADNTDAPPLGHPVDVLQRENEALKELATRLRTILRGAAEAGSLDDAARRGLMQAFNELMDIEKHYQRKEHLLFPKLEAHGIMGPPQVMWGKHDEVRAQLKALGPILADADLPAIRPAIDGVLWGVEGMIQKEERILFPMCMGTLTEDEWGEVHRGEAEIGWCLISPSRDWQPPAPAEGTPVVDVNGAIDLGSGTMTPAQLISLFKTLPVDLTFVDAEDRVRFFSEGPERIFPRPLAIIGRKVQHCHPPQSIDTVDRILDDFKAGRQSVAEFWIDFHGSFAHIRYFPLRDAAGQYLGTLEVSQNLTPLRALEGERRLLQYTS